MGINTVNKLISKATEQLKSRLLTVKSGFILSCGMMKQEESLIRTVQTVVFGLNQLLKNILPVHILYCSWLSGCDMLELALQMQRATVLPPQGHRFGLIRREYLL